MAIYRGTGGSIVGVDQADSFIVSVGQGGTGADNVTDARTNLGLGSAAIKDETYFATAAQGALADTSVQTSDIGVTVLAPNGSAASLTGFPTFNQDTTGTADNVTGVVAIANGGTGQTTAVAARAALLPSYATNGGKILAVKADASDVEYIEVSGTGTVTSVGMSVPTGLSVSGSPVTTAGTLAVTYTSGYAIPTTAKQTEWDTAYTDRNKWDGGSTGLVAATGRTSLGLGTAATTAATDYATAAQGTKADSALQSSAIGVSIQGYDVDTTKNDVANTFTANQVIAVTDNTNAALRITQLGTGNALLVEDSSNPDSTPFVIDTTGNVLVGLTTAQSVNITGTTVTSALQLFGTSANKSALSLHRAQASGAGPSLVLNKSRGSTEGSVTAVVSGDAMGSLIFQGADGANSITGARIIAEVDDTPGTNDMPGRLVFSTTANGASSPTERMRIDSSGIITATAGNLMLVSGTAVASTSGTSIDFTSIPSWVKRITVMFKGVSMSSTNDILVQLGTGGTPTTTGYISGSGRASGSSAAGVSSTAGMIVYFNTAANTLEGQMVLTNITSNTWTASHSFAWSNGSVSGGGSIALGGTLNMLRIKSASTDTFDAGSINILYE